MYDRERIRNLVPELIGSNVVLTVDGPVSTIFWNKTFGEYGVRTFSITDNQMPVQLGRFMIRHNLSYAFVHVVGGDDTIIVDAVALGRKIVVLARDSAMQSTSDRDTYERLQEYGVPLIEKSLTNPAFTPEGLLWTLLTVIAGQQDISGESL